MKPKPNRIVGLDNFERSPDEETRLNFIFDSVFFLGNGNIDQTL